MKVFTKHDYELAAQARRERRVRDLAATRHYKLDWMDENWWLLLAKQRKVRLPPMHRPATPQGLRTWARKLGKTPFREHFGCTPGKLIALNPRVPLRAFVGQMLEP